MCGRSYLFWQCDRDWSVIGVKEPTMTANLMQLMSAKLELYLNTLAALEDIPIHFEVFNDGKVIDSTPYIWPYYEAQKVVQQYDIDLVMVMINAGESPHHYYQAPMTSDGIPEEYVDVEYNEKPFEEKFKSGPLHDFFSLLEKKKMDTRISAWEQWLLDEQLRDRLADIMSRPLAMLKNKFDAVKTGQVSSCQLCLCYFPAGSFGAFPYKSERALWKGITSKNNLPFLDMTDDLMATRYTYYPLSDMIATDHFSKDGHAFFAELLAYELIKNKIIPFQTPNSQ
jgi:hypothetical protein